MSEAISAGKAAFAAEEGKLKKLLKAIKKIFAKEFLWLLFILLISVPLALIINYLLYTYADNKTIVDLCELLDGFEIKEACYAVSIAGFYFSRTLIGAIKTLTEKTEN